MRYCGNCSQEIPPETDHYKDGENTVYCTDCIARTPVVEIHFFLNGEYVGSDEDNDGIEYVEAEEDEFEVDPLEDVPEGQISMFEEAAE